MNANTKSLLTVSDIAKRNNGLPLLCVAKADAMWPFYLSSRTSRQPDILAPGQETMPMRWRRVSRLCRHHASTIQRQFNPHSATT